MTQCKLAAIHEQWANNRKIPTSHRIPPFDSLVFTLPRIKEGLEDDNEPAGETRTHPRHVKVLDEERVSASFWMLCVEHLPV